MKLFFNLLMFLAAITAVGFAIFAYLRFDASAKTFPEKFTYNWISSENPYLESTQRLVEIRSKVLGVELTTSNEVDTYTLILIDDANHTYRVNLNPDELNNTQIFKFSSTEVSKIQLPEFKTDLFNQSLQRV